MIPPEACDVSGAKDSVSLLESEVTKKVQIAQDLTKCSRLSKSPTGRHPIRMSVAYYPAAPTEEKLKIEKQGSILT